MAKIDKNFFDIGYTDQLSRQLTSIHRLDPRAKLVTTLVFITTVVSFGKYEISALLPFFVYPVALTALGNLPPAYLLKKILLVSMKLMPWPKGNHIEEKRRLAAVYNEVISWRF